MYCITESDENDGILRRPKAIVTKESKLHKNDGDDDIADDGVKSSGEEWDAKEDAKDNRKAKRNKTAKNRKSKTAVSEDVAEDIISEDAEMKVQEGDGECKAIKKNTSKKSKNTKETQVASVEETDNVDENIDMQIQDESTEEAFIEPKMKRKKKTSKKNTKQPADIITKIKKNANDLMDLTESEDDAQPKKAATTKNSKVTSKESDDSIRFLRTNTDAVEIPDLDDSDGEDDVINNEHRMNIRDAFANDDVIEDFMQEKNAELEKSKPKVVDNVLPGWGEWGGAGLKVSTRKRKRFTFVPRVDEGKKRRDDGKQAVIINEARNKSLAKHQVIISKLLFLFLL